LIFGCEKPTPVTSRSRFQPLGLYRLKNSAPSKISGIVEELKIPTDRLTIENVQQKFANDFNVPLQDDDFVISNIGYLVKFANTVHIP